MSKATGDFLSQFEAKEIEGSPPPPSWNVAPTQDVPIIAERLDDDAVDRRLLVARWGLVPSWANDIKIGSKLINARSESILDKPSFRKAAVKRRALIPAEGYYEWKKLGALLLAPGYSNEVIYIFKAWDLKAASAEQDEDEYIEFHR